MCVRPTLHTEQGKGCGEAASGKAIGCMTSAWQAPRRNLNEIDYEPASALAAYNGYASTRNVNTPEKTRRVLEGDERHV